MTTKTKASVVQVPTYDKGSTVPQYGNIQGISGGTPDAFTDKRALELGQEAANDRAMGQAVQQLGDVVASSLFKLQDMVDKTDVQEKYNDLNKEYNEWEDAEKSKPEYKTIDGVKNFGVAANKKFKELSDKYSNKLGSFNTKRMFKENTGVLGTSVAIKLSGYQASEIDRLNKEVNEVGINNSFNSLAQGNIFNEKLAEISFKEIETSLTNIGGEPEVIQSKLKDIKSKAAITALNKYLIEGSFADTKTAYNKVFKYLTVEDNNSALAAMRKKEINEVSYITAKKVYDKHGVNKLAAIREIRAMNMHPDVERQTINELNFVENNARVAMAHQINDPVTYQVSMNAGSQLDLQNILDVSGLDEGSKANIQKAWEFDKAGQLKTIPAAQVEVFNKIQENPQSVNLYDYVAVLSKEDFTSLHGALSKALEGKGSENLLNGMSTDNYDRMYNIIYKKPYDKGNSGDVYRRTELIKQFDNFYKLNKPMMDKLDNKDKQMNEFYKYYAGTKLEIGAYNEQFIDLTKKRIEESGYNIRDIYMYTMGVTPTKTGVDGFVNELAKEIDFYEKIKGVSFSKDDMRKFLESKFKIKATEVPKVAPEINIYNSMSGL